MIRNSRALLSAVLFVMTSFSAMQASAANGPVFSVVYPTGVFPDDVNNVQAALNKGGTVFLKAFSIGRVPTAFNFGTAESDILQGGFVTLSTDVNFIGERVGSHRATISGGFGPICTLCDAVRDGTSNRRGTCAGALLSFAIGSDWKHARASRGALGLGTCAPPGGACLIVAPAEATRCEN